MRKMKIIAFMNAYTQGMSGGDHRFIEVVKRFINKDIKIEVITSRLGKKVCENQGLKDNVSYKITTNEQNIHNITFLYLKRIFAALKLNLSRKENTENNIILYSTSDFLPDTLPAFVWKLKNKKVKWVQIIHHIVPNPSKRKGNTINNFISYIAQRISFLLIRHHCDLIIVVNPLMREILAEIGFNISKIKINPNGIDMNYFKDIKASKENYHAVFLGRLHPSKGIFDLVEIWKLVCRKIPNAKLAIIGGGDKKIEEELKNKIKIAGLSNNIDVFGYLENDRAFGILKSSKVFVFPSHEEGFGIAILEAMACGLPVVAWDLPVYEEIFPRGIIKVTEGDYEKFADKILELLENKELYRKLSTEAKKVAQKYDWDSIAENELKLIREILENDA